MEPPPSLPRHMEIANLEHRLAMLREQQQSFARQSDYVKCTTWIAIAVSAVVVTALAFTTRRDPVPMLVFFSIFLAVAALLAWMFRHADWSMDMSQPFGPRNRYTSYRTFLEESVQDCERSLAELKARP
jgi:hypothetical protein